MQFSQAIQNTWKNEGMFHILPSLALYHAKDMMTNDYGFMITWLSWSWDSSRGGGSVADEPPRLAR